MTQDFDRAALAARVKEEISEQARAAIVARIPPLTDEQATLLEMDTNERDRVMREFGDPELFFEWLKTRAKEE